MASSWSLRKVGRTIKRIGRLVTGRDVIYKYDAHPPKVFVGTDYGGWTIVAEGLRHESIVYSFGIGDDISFDLSMIGRFGLQVHGFDPTPHVAEWISGQSVPDEFHFHPYGLGLRDGNVSFFTPVAGKGNYSTRGDHSFVSGTKVSLDVKTLDTIVASLRTPSIAILKIDIEGAEYDILPAIVESSVPIEQVLIEFHHRAGVESLDSTVRAVDSLRSAGFRLFHVSETSSEFSFAHAKYLESFGA